MSPFHFHRVFREVTGITPAAFARARRAERLGAALPTRDGDGCALRSRLQRAEPLLRGGEGPARHAAVALPEGRGRGAHPVRRRRVQPGGDPRGRHRARGVRHPSRDEPEALVRDLQDRFPAAELIGGDADFEAWMARAVGLVEAPGRPHDLPLDIGGTAFQQRVVGGAAGDPARHHRDLCRGGSASGRRIPRAPSPWPAARTPLPWPSLPPCGPLDGFALRLPLGRGARKRDLLAREGVG